MKCKIPTALVCLLFAYACKTDPLARLPSFEYRSIDSITIVNTKDIPEDRPIVIIHFGSDCRDCQQTTDSLLQNMEKVKNVRFYFLSIEKFSQVTLFRDYYKLDKYPNVTVGQDYTHFLPKYFQTYATPIIALYNKKKILIGVFRGEPNIQVLVNAIKHI